MVFICQKDSFRTCYQTIVVSCEKSRIQLPLSGNSDADTVKETCGGNKKLTNVECFAVVCEDTVLFPEGGGQPDDHGIMVLLMCDACCHSTADTLITDSATDDDQLSNKLSVIAINGHGTPAAPLPSSCSCEGRVLRVLRRGAEAVLYVTRAFSIGDRVEQRVDWPRRLDHMQQHSAQHLITAMADNLYGFPTTSWSLAPLGGSSSIELATPALSTDQLVAIERAANSIIARGLPVTVDEYEQDDPRLLEGIRGRGLPADVSGPVRVVSLAGVDCNMCCGTHVTNTAQLLAVKLLHVDKGKQNKVLLHFVAGDRLVSFLNDSYSKLRSLQSLLATNSDGLVSSVQKLQSSLKLCDKTSREALRDLAVCEARLFKVDHSGEKVWFHHKKLADLDYLGALVNSINDEDVLKVFTAGEEKGPGLLLIHGPPGLVGAVAQRVCKLLDGKGGGKSRFTAKVMDLHRREQAYQLVRDILDSPGRGE